jgi:hypothetical protein
MLYIWIYVSDVTEITPAKAGISLIAGFLCRALVDNVKCSGGGLRVVNLDKNGIGSLLIQLQDRGGLLYPMPRLLGRVFSILEFLKEFNSVFRKLPHISRHLYSLILPSVKQSGIVQCGCENDEHSSLLQKIFLDKLIKIYLNNVASCETESA